MGRQPFNLVEPGAGSGRMMKDVLASMRNEDPLAYGFADAYIADYGVCGRDKNEL
jgi:SAM-dependent MidA family methyltransferase